MGTDEKIAVFDFCETLISFQTADAFLNYVYEKTHSPRMRLTDKALRLFYRLGLAKLLNRQGFWEKRSLNKKWRIYALRGFDERKLKEWAHRFYQERLRPGIIKPVLTELQAKKKAGYRIGIVSGGFDIYIDYFAADYGVDFVLASQIGFKQGVCTGRLVGPDCMREQKLVAIQELYPSPPVDSCSYSDSISDLPILLWATHGIVISKNKHQAWCEQYNFSEIIWEQEPANS